jgi:hypothetical protein
MSGRSIASPLRVPINTRRSASSWCTRTQLFRACLGSLISRSTMRSCAVSQRGHRTLRSQCTWRFPPPVIFWVAWTSSIPWTSTVQAVAPRPSQALPASGCSRLPRCIAAWGGQASDWRLHPARGRNGQIAGHPAHHPSDGNGVDDVRATGVRAERRSRLHATRPRSLRISSSLGATPGTN